MTPVIPPCPAFLLRWGSHKLFGWASLKSLSSQSPLLKLLKFAGMSHHTWLFFSFLFFFFAVLEFELTLARKVLYHLSTPPAFLSFSFKNEERAHF
jgi:hypothetical protein